jgi:hypothetical protein
LEELERSLADAVSQRKVAELKLAEFKESDITEKSRLKRFNSYNIICSE